MLNRLFLFASLFVFFVSACNSPNKEVSQKVYFDLNGFIDKQIEILNKRKPLINKVLKIEDKQEKTRVQITDWEKELALFRQANLNKPAYNQSYETQKPDSLTVEYKLKPTENLPVKSLKIVFDSHKQVANISAQLTQKTYLFQSEKNLSIHCASGLIKSYKIEGVQHLKASKKTRFEVLGELR